ncbi:hypothetical protein SAMD00019534_123370 [Acytostelium subglobosum LB1]|uniref:hypothetical protein n=1 Tax=Acytostelium subglobosum LB1 TaxID=1410327 RepID=UPI000644E202|nr:hypothetical protein SAMD00019534_123370 [Acytostelium subglobosum LB1]GAM29161.1 hypothetical protein SAMD00019534_123370 [Acytostelium subglobosum LB1]|eukprot:XP_012747852.1 hypothetical protein SAMD00019534_123370 [Acytostelium subglobosum LB1]
MLSNLIHLPHPQFTKLISNNNINNIFQNNIGNPNSKLEQKILRKIAKLERKHQDLCGHPECKANKCHESRLARELEKKQMKIERWIQRKDARMEKIRSKLAVKMPALAAELDKKRSFLRSLGERKSSTNQIDNAEDSIQQRCAEEEMVEMGKIKVKRLSWRKEINAILKQHQPGDIIPRDSLKQQIVNIQVAKVQESIQQQFDKKIIKDTDRYVVLENGDIQVLARS